MTKTLREQLIGAWKLVSHVEKPVDGSEPVYPMGEKLEGIIIYAPDGYMSVQIMRPGRPKFASGDWFDSTDKEIKEAARGYFAYSGPVHTDEEKKTSRTRCSYRWTRTVGPDTDAGGKDRRRHAPPEHGKAVGIGGQGDDVLSHLETS